MKKSASGFILLFTLLMILVVSLLVVTAMHYLLLYQKNMSRQEERHQVFYQMERTAMQLGVRKPNQDCVAYTDSANYALKKLFNHQGCSITLGRYQFRYWVEELGDDPCLVIRNRQGIYATHHRRVSLALTNTLYAGALLQIRMVSPVRSFACFDELREVQSGVVSWRYLP